MTIRSSLLLAVAACAAATPAAAQKEPAVRPLGPITRVSTEPLASVITVVPLSDGHVYVNDVVSRRILLFDSTLSSARIVADSTAVTSKAYGARPGALFAYRGDTALFSDPASGSMPVLSPAGTIARVMAAPTVAGPIGLTLGNPFYPPGFDAQGRLVSMMPLAVRFDDPIPGKPSTQKTLVDSSLVARFDLGSRTLDTVATVKGPKVNQVITRDEDGRLTSMKMTPDIVPVVDDWTVLPDGSLAVVRGRDYHVDWLGADGKWRSTSKMPFEWQHFDDAQKTATIDSALTAIKARRDSMMTAVANRGPTPARVEAAGGAVVGARGGRGGGGGDGAPPPALIDGRPELSDLPDYRPPFTRGSTRADADGNLWIRTTTLVKGQPVYDIVNEQGTIVDRVQIPPFRTIAGFGPGMVYMAVKDSAGVVHLEKARIK
ncbi:MAG TPA: hypothetical protein VGQ44_10210 [Gemmatimonadaceae bacterium]|jgi:hypothetical protein|nr:hypothetical protein [Gemmatimonadaceae bacterium]